ncbi:MAG: hypothetical protein R3F61_00205 [Myxococcota bacterium]
MISALIGCGDGPSSLTVVEDLRILDLTLEPASPVPGEVPSVDLLVADPTGQGFDTWAWWCTDTSCGDGPVDASPALTVYGLACAPGACEGPGDNLAAPESWVAGLPIEGTSFVRRTVPISGSTANRLNDNPVLAPVGTVPEQVGVASRTVLTFAVTDTNADTPLLYGFSTWGGFASAVGTPVVDGLASLELIAPEEPGEGVLYVVVDDGLGGSAVWTGPIGSAP